MAIFGLLVSSSALVIIQGVMGGLQNGLIKRSKNVLGHYKIEVFERSEANVGYELIDELKKLDIPFTAAYEIELLFKKGDYLYPVILNGIDPNVSKPEFLAKKDFDGIVIGAELASKLNAYLDSKIEIISPLHTASILGEIPRFVSEDVSDFFMSDVAEVDATHAWTRLSLVQNLIRKKRINSLRIYTDKKSEDVLNLVEDKFKNQVQMLSWEQMNQTLVWALRLETSMMLFLFICMTFLVSISITSGFMIFFDKVKVDLISFWILGKSQEELYRLTQKFTYLLSFCCALVGVASGIGVLLVLKYSELKIFPSFFVEQKIPVSIAPVSTLIAFVVPFAVASVFSKFAFKFFKKENQSFIGLIRKVG